MKIRRGMTLVEVLVSSAILLALLPAAVMMVSTSAGMAAKAERDLALVYAIGSKMEELRGIDRASLPELDGRTFDDGAGRISVKAISGDLLQIEVSHRTADGSRSMRASTLRSGY